MARTGASMEVRISEISTGPTRLAPCRSVVYSIVRSMYHGSTAATGLYDSGPGKDHRMMVVSHFLNRKVSRPQVPWAYRSESLWSWLSTGPQDCHFPTIRTMSRRSYSLFRDEVR